MSHYIEIEENKRDFLERKGEQIANPDGWRPAPAGMCDVALIESGAGAVARLLYDAAQLDYVFRSAGPGRSVTFWRVSIDVLKPVCDTSLEGLLRPAD